MEEAIRMAGAVEIPIYAFELIRSKWVEEGKETPIDELPLMTIAQATGGLYFRLDPGLGEDLDRASAKIFEDLKYQYYIGYVPHGSPTSYGKVELKTKKPNHRARAITRRSHVLPKSDRCAESCPGSTSSRDPWTGRCAPRTRISHLHCAAANTRAAARRG